MMRVVSGMMLWLAGTIAFAGAAPLELVWPTPSTAWREGRPASEFLQHAGSGDPASGGFGGVRSGGGQFHEGIDIQPVRRDRRGEPLDEVMAAMAGVVRHISKSAGDSSYGRYVVLEHPDAAPTVFTLYAHLSSVAPELREGDRVRAGQSLGVMGHSAGGYTIPRDRAHLHFEIGLMVTRDFQRWYDARKFGSRNTHTIWNGMNLMGIDPLDFFDQWRAKKVTGFTDYFQKMTPAVRLRIATREVPDFVRRYPELLTRPLPELVGGWEIAFNWTGLPFSWTPLTPMEAIGLPAEKPSILEVNADLERRERSKTLAVRRAGSWSIGRDLQTVLQQLFAGR